MLTRLSFCTTRFRLSAGAARGIPHQAHANPITTGFSPILAARLWTLPFGPCERQRLRCWVRSRCQGWHRTQRTYRRGQPYRLRARLPTWRRGHRVEEGRWHVSIWPVPGLDQRPQSRQRSRCSGSAARCGTDEPEAARGPQPYGVAVTRRKWIKRNPGNGPTANLWKVSGQCPRTRASMYLVGELLRANCGPARQ